MIKMKNSIQVILKIYQVLFPALRKMKSTKHQYNLFKVEERMTVKNKSSYFPLSQKQIKSILAEI